MFMFIFKRPLALVVFTSALLWTPTQALAGVIYSNFDSNFPASTAGIFDSAAGYFATNFTASASGTLASIEFDLSETGSATAIPAWLYADSGDEPGTLLESWSVPLPPYPEPSLTVLTSVVNPVLSAGAQYWLVFDEGSLNGFTNWLQNDENISGGIWLAYSPTSLIQYDSTSQSAGLEVLSTSTSSVPEPGSGVLFGIGGLFLAGMARIQRRRQSSS
jgi:hypothetical protein